ncbi:mitochondrial ornithine carrier protein [Cryptotrichosporon argae]
MGHSSHDALRDVTFGSIAGMAAKFFEHPFDLVKVRLQSQPTDRPLAFTGPLDCFRQTYAREGWRGLYRGISAPIVGAACENASLFLMYNKCQAVIVALRPGDSVAGKRRELSIGELMVAAAGAGAVASFVLTPIELIKCRMQVQMLAREGAFDGSASRPAVPQTCQLARALSTSAPTVLLRPPAAHLPPPLGPFQLIASIARTSGFRGLWLGQVGTLFRETGGSSAWFGAYEIASRYFLSRRAAALDHTSAPDRPLTKADLHTWQLVVSGALAGMSYNVVLFPADSVKSAMQTSAELNPHLPPPSFWATARRIWATRGVKGLYAGCGLTVARAAPSSAMIFLIYESLAKQFGWAFD